jgi:hypothetical protein
VADFTEIRNPRADFDLNGSINIKDFALLAANYGKSSPVIIP